MSRFPKVLVCVAVALPLFIFLIIWGMPKEDEEEVPEEDALPTDPYMIKVVICFIVVLLAGVIGGFVVFGMDLLTFVYAQRTNSDVQGIKTYDDLNMAEELKDDE